MQLQITVTFTALPWVGVDNGDFKKAFIIKCITLQKQMAANLSRLVLNGTVLKKYTNVCLQCESLEPLLCLALLRTHNFFDSYCG